MAEGSGLPRGTARALLRQQQTTAEANAHTLNRGPTPITFRMVAVPPKGATPPRRGRIRLRPQACPGLVPGLVPRRLRCMCSHPAGDVGEVLRCERRCCLPASPLVPRGKVRRAAVAIHWAEPGTCPALRAPLRGEVLELPLSFSQSGASAGAPRNARPAGPRAGRVLRRAESACTSPHRFRRSPARRPPSR